jgi:hypothetical protein
MTDPRCNVAKNLPPLAIAALATTGPFGAVAFPHAPSARGDTVAYLLNVTVRPCHHFANAHDALADAYRVSRVVPDYPGGQLSMPGADLAAAQLHSALPSQCDVTGFQLGWEATRSLRARVK